MNAESPKPPQCVLILGASSGLGHELARCYIRRGCTVALAARRTEPLYELARLAAPGQQVEVAQIDVCRPMEAVATLQLLYGRMGGRMDVYFHCAGIGRMEPVVDYAAAMPTLQTNVMGWTACIDWAFATLLRQGAGQLAAITSFAATRGLGAAPAYSATKAFQAHYLEALRQRVLAARLPVAVTDLRPGFVRTPLLAHPERLFWVLSAPRAVRAMLRAVDSRAAVRTLTLRWRLLAPLLRMAPRALVARIVALALR